MDGKYALRVDDSSIPTATDDCVVAATVVLPCIQKAVSACTSPSEVILVHTQSIGQTPRRQVMI